MSPKKRNRENKGLPARWRHRKGGYYYRVPPGMSHLWDGKKSEFLLGATKADAYREWSRRLDMLQEAQTISALIDRYLIEHLSELSPKTVESYTPAAERIRSVFGAMSPRAFEAHHAAKYHDELTRARSRAVARTDITVLRSLFTFAMACGAVKAHPMTGMRFKQLPAASDVVEDWEIDAMLSVPADTRSVLVGQLYVKLKLMLGLRRGDMLTIRLSDIRDDGIHCVLNKTRNTSGVRMVFPWLDPETGEEFIEFRSIVNQILAIPPRRIGDAFLFTTRAGKGFMDPKTGRANGFDTLWQRFTNKVMQQTDVDHRIKEKTLRAYVANASASDDDAMQRLGHTTKTTTLKHYRRKARVVVPLARDTKQ